MLEELIEYFNNPLDIGCMGQLAGSLFDFNFADYEQKMQDAWRNYVLSGYEHDSVELQSNGSTGGKKGYYFGSNFSILSKLIESRLRERDKKTVTIVFSPRSGISTKNTSHREDAVIFADPNSDSELCQNLDLIRDRFSVFNIMALPNVWIYLSTNNAFRDWVEENKLNINAFVNTDWDLSMKPIDGVYIRDQMIDWKSGLNFYTCRSGTVHFIPIFFESNQRVYNVLNLCKDSRPIDDLYFLDANSLRVCGCGKSFIPLKIIPHHEYRITNDKGEPIDTSGFYDNLKSNYLNLQVHQDLEGKVTVFYRSKQPDTEDLGCIFNFLNSKGIEKIRFMDSRYFKVGSKTYSFWRSKKVKINEIFT